MSSVSQIATITKSEKSINAKDKLEKFVEVLDKKLQSYFKIEIDNTFGVGIEEKEIVQYIYKHIQEHNLRPAKRLRGSFIYYAYKMFNGLDERNILDAAMSIELVHTALLMHDDFMDQDAIRRGLPTAHIFYKNYHDKNKFRGDSNHYGESMAVVVGDIALCMGFEILANVGGFPTARRLKALQKMLRGIRNTSLGQSHDVTLENKGKATEENIIDLHSAKTAIYTYENPLHIGAILGGASKLDLRVLSQYAIPGGIAFQLQDDILGLFGDPEKTGKPAHSDLRQGKMTLLVVKALEKANLEQRRTLHSLWGKRDITDEEAEIARKIVKDTGSLDYSRSISVYWAKKAQNALPLMKKRGWNEEGIAYLDGIAQYMIEREM